VLSKYTLCHPVGWQFVGSDTLTPLTTDQSVRRLLRPSSEPPAAVSILLLNFALSASLFLLNLCF
jgi:hypothetical protein